MRKLKLLRVSLSVEKNSTLQAPKGTRQYMTLHILKETTPKVGW
jgi:hypothetical protein